MFTDLKVIHNFFKEPDKIRALALSQAFHTFEEEQSFIKNNSRFPGRRTNNLFEVLDKQTYNNIMDEFYSKIFYNNIREDANLEYNIKGFPLFHSLYQNDSDLGCSGMHKDSTIYAAVVYLNSPPDSGDYGTHVLTSNNNCSIIEVPYTYNTCVMYRGDYVHGAWAGFGDTIETSRLSMNFFISDIEIKMNSFSL